MEPSGADLRAAARLLALEIPPPCEAGVHANLALLQLHARVLDKLAPPEKDAAT